MRNKTIRIAGVLFVLIFNYATLNAQIIQPTRTSDNVVSLNGLWKFRLYTNTITGNDSSFYKPDFATDRWANIRVPSNWEMQGFAEPVYGKVKNDGIGLYKRDFLVPANWKNQPVYVAFDGVLFGYTCWVNGQFAGEFASAFNRQTFDISALVKPDQTNEIAVKVTRLPKGWEFDIFDCWSLSGIYRDVTLFSVPAVHINDLVVTTILEGENGVLSIKTNLEKTPKAKFSKQLSLMTKLMDHSGRIVAETFTEKLSAPKKTNELTINQGLRLSNPNLWTAETPYLYTLEVILSNKNRVLQKQIQKIGVRQITRENGVLKLNGQTIKLRGVNYHNLSPVNGRAVTDAEFLHDIKLIREANINFIRTSHYPPNQRLLDLCDSLGIYVMDEVPFGWGEDHLNDKSYLDNLKTRAKTTITRDKNHPSVIIWSVGNENPLTKMCVEVGKYVHQLDSTRPHCFPQIGSYFRSIQDSVDASVDILTPHYAVPSQLRGYSRKFNRPMIVTEYAHSLGLDFDRMEESWEIMYANPKMAGGAVWHFFDQGILRKSNKKTIPGTFTEAVWTDSVTMYDNNGNMGADGIVYADRTPQVDYWQVRKVYTSVKVEDDTLVVRAGKQTIQLNIQNRYDFTDLSDVHCSWSVWADTSVIDKGSCVLEGKPHTTNSVGLTFELPQELNATFYRLELQFSDKSGYVFSEKVLPFRSTKNMKNLLTSKTNKPILKAGVNQFGNNTLTIHPQTGAIQLVNAAGIPVILNGPFARMGRKPTLSELATTGRSINDLNKVQKPAITGDPLLDEKPKNDKNPIWFPNLIQNPVVKVLCASATKVIINYTYERPNGHGQFVGGNVEYALTDSGRLDVSYKLIPQNATGTVLEAGISFLLPATLSEFRWVGKGPYASYPGKDRLNEFGIFHLNSADLNYQGNRSDVEMAVLTDKAGNGFVLLAPKANIAVEKSAEGIVLSHNAFVSGRFNKGNMPEVKVNVEKRKEISGSFSLIPLAGEWGATLQSVFGNINKTVVPFVPFYNSYDQ